METNNNQQYIHGFSEEEQLRLISQNQVLSPEIYSWLDFSKSKKLLEIGCGVGAQILELHKRYPQLHITGMDINPVQIDKARTILKENRVNDSRIHLFSGDIQQLLDSEERFDDILLVWVLEHVNNPLELLKNAKKLLKKGGKIHITEVYNQSFHLHPEDHTISLFWQKMNQFQQNCGGDGNVGLKLGNLLTDAGYQKIKTHAHPLHFDKTKKQRRSIFIDYWNSLMRSSALSMISLNIISEMEWVLTETAMQNKMADQDAVFFYCWIQASGEY